jgi:hypothetical protein
MKELWKKYYGKKVKWSGNVSSISDSFGTQSLQVKINPHSFSSDVFVKLKDNERDKAIKLKEGDLVTFTGILDNWGTLVPVTLDHGKIVK